MGIEYSPGDAGSYRKIGELWATTIESLTAEEERKNPTPAMAVIDLMKENNIPVPIPQVDMVGKNIPNTGGAIHIRIYTSKAAMSSYPLIFYIHSGGWVYG